MSRLTVLDVADDSRAEAGVILVEAAGVVLDGVGKRTVDRVVRLQHDHVPASQIVAVTVGSGNVDRQQG